MSGIGIITNPYSKLNKRNPKRAELLGYILGQQGQLEVTKSLEDLGRVAREFRERKIEILAINGGDGTISRTLTAFVSEYEAAGVPLPKVALLRGGTINMLAGNLAIKGAPEQILYRLVEAHSSGVAYETVQIPTVKVEGNYGFLFGNGVGAYFLQEYYKKKSGPFGAALWIFFVFASRLFGGKMYYRVARDMQLSLAADGEPPIGHSTVAVFAATVRKMPLGYPLFKRNKPGSDHFQTVSFAFPAKDAIWKLPAIMVKNQDGSHSGKLNLVSRSLTIEAEQPFDYTLDGELFVSKDRRLTVTMGPRIEFVAI